MDAERGSSTIVLSFWRLDAVRRLRARARHLLGKTATTWLWVVGDSADDTEAQLRAIAAGDPRVTILRHDTGIEGEAPRERLRRFSDTADAGLAAIGPDVDRLLIHESDIESPPDVVARLAGGRGEAVGAWPIITLGGRQRLYDTFCVRAAGRGFDPDPPYHPVYRPDARFEVDSVGSVWSMPAWPVQAGARCDGLGAIGLCAALRRCGVRLFVDPRLLVVQPADLWTPQAPPPLPAEALV